MPHPDDQTTAETVAWVALRRLQNRYADIVTRRAWSELHEIMRADCTVTVDLLDRRIEFAGPGEIGAFIGTQLEQFDFFEFVILNTVMDIDASTGTAAARMYIQEARQNRSDGRRSDTYGVYHDSFDRDPDGRWWFRHRRYRSYARTNPTGTDTDLTVFDLPALELGDL